MRSCQKGLLAIALLCCAVSSTLAATCTTDSQNVINTADIMQLVNDFATNDFSPPLDDPLGFSPDQTHFLTHGTAGFCIANSFFFKSTHIKLSDVVSAANDILSQCCSSDNPVCQGGQFTITGDNGITVRLFVVPKSEGCNVF